MADFVAVIRRAVDGLANNTPEMRIRVYEKARGAVQRQLENMKPRPSDDMLRRQMEKLEAAIRSVEAEHQEALPVDNAPPVAAAPVPVAVPVDPQPEPEPELAAHHEEPVEEAYRDTAPVEAPQDAEPYHTSNEEEDHSSPVEEAVPAPQHEPYVAETPAYSAPAYEAEPEEQSQPQWQQPVEPEPAYEQSHEPQQDVQPEPLPTQPYDVASYHASEPDWRNADSQETAPPVRDENTYDPASEAEVPKPAYTDRLEPEYQAADPFADEAEQDEAQRFRDEVAAHEEALAADHPVDQSWQPQAAERVEEPEQEIDRDLSFDGDRPSYRSTAKVAPAWPDAPSTAPVVRDSESSVTADSYHDDLRDEPQVPAAQSAQRFDDAAAADLFSAHFSEEQHATADSRMPPIADFPDFEPQAQEKTGNNADDPLAEFLKPQAAEPTARSKPEKEESDPWNDLEELIGFDRNTTGGAAPAGAAAAASVAASPRAVDAPERPRVEPEESSELEELMAAPAARSYRVQPKRKRSLAPILLAVLGILLLCGGGYAIWMNRDALSGIIGSADKGAASQQAAAPANAPASSSQQAANQPQPTSAAPAAQQPASGEADGPQKFTQRLLPNGTEVDDGSGGPAADGQNQSVAQLNAAGAAAATDAPAADANAAAPTNAPATPDQPANTIAAAGDKIFLYEERVGQSSPTAVEGTVSWSLQKEEGENGRTEPAVQGRISIPGRGLTALITFKRNTDQSLPASHLVEFVFSLPPNFEGGSIDSVQRISMKQNEQDRGDALVAVPAKITSDFHMIALNDFPDARTRNLELLKSRDWMDVPLVYGNGRRALLTLQKGEDGRKAFDEAIKEWQAAAPQQGQ